MMDAPTRSATLALPLLAVMTLLGGASTAQAGWDNVFQVTCWNCGSKPVRSFFRDLGTPATPQSTVQREVHPEQRCYYEPVTVMKPERYMEEVPVKVKSYYWEPVTTYTYSSYYDDCSGKCQKIAVPRTSYVRKEDCNTVMKYVERVRMVPTQVQRKVCETRQVVTYYGPITKTYECDSCELPSSSSAPPRVDVMPGTSPSVAPSAIDPIPPQQMPTFKNSLPKQNPSRTRTDTRPPVPTAPIKVNAQTTSYTPSLVRGEVVSSDRVTPRPGARVVFMNAANQQLRQLATTDDFGNFDLQIPPGEWYVYLSSGRVDGKAQFYKKVTISPADATEFKLVSR